MKTKALYIISLFFCLHFGPKVYAQAQAPTFATALNNTAVLNYPPPAGTPVMTRPATLLNVPALDTYVNNCYDLYGQTNYVSTQLNAIDQQLIVNKLSQMQTENIESQVTGFKTQLLGLQATGETLVQSGAAMANDVPQNLKNSPLKIPAAYVRVKNATKAVDISLKNIHTGLTVTLVDIETRLHPSAAKRDSLRALSGKVMKTTITVTGISFSLFNSLTLEVKGTPGVKSANKNFNSAGNSKIAVVHCGTTDDLLQAMLTNCKDVVSEKNVKRDQKGKITLAF